MHTHTRLLLPFTEGISALALDYALQMAEQQRATLVPCALIPVCPDNSVRTEHIQQAQDFLELTKRKAGRQGVPIEPAQVYTRDVVSRIESFASEMACEAVLLFLSNARGVLLGHAVIRSLLDQGNCNVHVVLLPGKRKRGSVERPLSMPLAKRLDQNSLDSRSGSLLWEQTQEHLAFIYHTLQPGNV